MPRRAGRARLLGRLLLLALLAAGAAPLGWGRPEPLGRAGRIRVHARGHLWATGHFMGKKSPELPSPAPEGPPAPSPRAQQLSHHLLRILFLEKALGGRPGRLAPLAQEAAAARPAPGRLDAAAARAVPAPGRG